MGKRIQPRRRNRDFIGYGERLVELFYFFVFELGKRIGSSLMHFVKRRNVRYGKFTRCNNMHSMCRGLEDVTVAA